jgi:hypothetical protein
MSARRGVTLQINLAPTDLPHARHILPHQLSQWAGQVDEVLLTFDLHRSGGRFSEAWEERLPGMRDLLERCCVQYPTARLSEVDYSAGIAAEIARRFFGGHPVPAKDWNGGPFYSYFFGLHAAATDYVFHLDSDMMFGGGSQTWLAEAVKLLQERTDVLICSPLPGPPVADGSLVSQGRGGLPREQAEPYPSAAFRFPHLSSRLFLMDLPRFATAVGHLPMTQPPRIRRLQARVRGNPPFNLPEAIFSAAMTEHSLFRVDFLGEAPGMWAIHPPYRSPEFYQALPGLIERIEAGDVPDAQRGDHDVNDSMVDWSSARAAQHRWWKPIVRRLTS